VLRVDCTRCQSLLNRIRSNRLLKIGVISDYDEVDIQTWCRICGEPAMVTLPYNYEMAIDQMCEMDGEVSEHGYHSEEGGWGYHLRFDDILLFLFTGEHLDNGPLWEKPTWYTHNENEELAVNFVSSEIMQAPR